MSMTTAPPDARPQEAVPGACAAAVVEFCLLGLRAEFQRAREAVAAGDEAEHAAAQAQIRSLLSRLGVGS
ncbi:MAG: hypothetical protein KY457_02800 [Actinobacteria bacterium]|nr:hypothetical protein [Actinomycetota bacterium]